MPPVFRFLIPGLFCFACVLPAAEKPALEHDFTGQVRPLLRQYCLKCHDAAKHKGDLDLTPFTNLAKVQQDFKTWQKVLQQVEDEEMPPKDPQPGPAEREQLTNWVRQALETIDWSKQKSAGHVTIPRLTKEEYNHTLRDLLGIDLHAGDALLDDGQGQSGFNNDRDALFISPALAEQYFDAADRALEGIQGLYRAPLKKRFESEAMFMTERGSKPENLPGGGEGYALNRGQMTLYDSVSVPCDGWYRFNVRAVGVGGDSGARLRIDNETSGDIKVKRDQPETQVLTVLLRKGTHQMAWNIELPRDLVELRKQQTTASKTKRQTPQLPRASLRSDKEAQEKVNQTSVKNAATYPASDQDSPKSRELIRRLDQVLVAVQRPIEWLRLTTVDGDPAELVSLLDLLPERLTRLNEARQALAKEMNVEPAEIERRIRESNREKLADNQKILAAARAVGGNRPERTKPAKPVRAGNAGIDWIEVEGPVVPEGQAGDLVFGAADADAAGVISRFLPRAFRRPVKDDESRRYLELYDQAVKRGEPSSQSLKLALVAVLVSPEFLFRDEFGKDDREFALNDYQLASRLSYFLWMSMPDEELRKLAAAGRLHEDEVLRQQIKRMIADARSREFMKAFLGQWLGFGPLGSGHVPDAKKFRDFTPELAEAMKLEPVMVFEKLLREGGSLLSLLDGRDTFVNADLARHYDLDDIHGEAMQPVKFSDDKRGGLLGMAAVLTTTSSPNRTSPVIRGKWVLETLLGRKLAEPPADAGQLDANAGEDRGRTLREELAAHRRNESCAACHAKIDPLGFGLENFDAIGRYRDMEADKPVDASGELPGGIHFNGAAELRGYLLENRKEEFVRNVTRRLLAFALGRDLRLQDEGTVHEILKAVKSNAYRADVLLESIVLSLPFRYQDGIKVSSTK